MRAALATLAAVLALAGCQDQSSVRFTDVSIDLPEDDGVFPERAGAEAMTANCTACHSPSMILNQPALTADQWRALITKMKMVYKAPIDPAAEPAILAYLTTTSADVIARDAARPDRTMP